MIVAVTYGDEKYKRAKKFNCRMAKKYGADKVIAFGPDDIDEDFKERNKAIWEQERGGGYWIWKPYVMKKALEWLQKGDYLVYTDAAAIFVKPIRCLIDVMDREGTDIMVFSLPLKEYQYTKRDAFILMDCDKEEFANSNQILGGYVILKKNDRTMEFIDRHLNNVQDERMVTDLPNQLGLPDYKGFIEHRHDQSAFSLLCKKEGIQPFRDPSQFGIGRLGFAENVCERSPYSQVICSFRNGRIGNRFQLKYNGKKWFKYTTWIYYKSILSNWKKRILKGGQMLI